MKNITITQSGLDNNTFRRFMQEMMKKFDELYHQSGVVISPNTSVTISISNEDDAEFTFTLTVRR